MITVARQRELCRTFHGIDCRRCAPAPRDTSASAFEIQIDRPMRIRIITAALPGGGHSIHVEEL